MINAEDLEAIRKTALDYIEGWYCGDADRMERSLHPDLAKRTLIHDETKGIDCLEPISALGLVIATRKGIGKRTPPELQRKDITILDTSENVACVRIDAADWVDFLHLARLNGQWLIVNVFWERRKTSMELKR